MFVGHFGAALAAKRAAPRVSLGDGGRPRDNQISEAIRVRPGRNALTRRDNRGPARGPFLIRCAAGQRFRLSSSARSRRMQPCWSPRS